MPNLPSSHQLGNSSILSDKRNLFGPKTLMIPFIGLESVLALEKRAAVFPPEN